MYVLRTLFYLLIWQAIEVEEVECVCKHGDAPPASPHGSGFAGEFS
jgi:hypothetical protein